MLLTIPPAALSSGASVVAGENQVVFAVTNPRGTTCAGNIKLSKKLFNQGLIAIALFDPQVFL